MIGRNPATELAGAARSCRQARRRCPPANRGFTLLEVCLAAFVMLVGFAGAFTCLRGSLQLVDNARYSTLASQILQSQAEKLRLLNWSQFIDPTTGPAAFPTFTPDIVASDSVAGAQVRNFTCTQTISDPPAGSPFAGTMKEITLTAAWVDSFGTHHSLSYFTIYVQNGISDFIYTTHN